MKNKTKKSIDAAFLRQKAEDLLKEKPAKKSVPLTEVDTIKLLHELEVHQIELEMQNEELQMSKEKAETNSEKYTNLYDFAPSGFFTLDSEFRICELNFNGALMLGKERSKLINCNFELFVLPKTRIVFSNFLDKVSETKIKQSCEVQLTINETPAIFVHIEGVFVETEQNFILTAVDISEQKQVEQALKESDAKLKISHEQLNATLNALPDLLFEIDKETIIYDYRASNSDLLFLPPSEFLGKAMKDILPKEASEKILFAIEKAAEYGNYSGIEYSLQLKNGINWFDISIAEKKHLNYYRYILLVKNITDRKNAEQALKESEAQLRELNAAKDKLFSIIAHDLRSPFNHILGFSELLIENVKNYEVAKSEKYLGIINSSAQNTLVLLDNLLNWAKSQAGQVKFNPEKVVLSSIIQEIFELSNSSAKNKNISLNHIPSEEIVVLADPNMIKTVLRNLISNAIKFTNSNGKINVTALQNDNFIEIAVSDDGVGMKDETLKNLFDISTNITTKGTANEKGSGLGLILCKEFVEKHGGKIWVESEEGKGSIFYFTLPYHTETVKENSAKNEILLPVEEISINKLKILIAEDDETSEMLISIAVKKFGKEIIRAKTGTEAVEACRKNQDIDLVLMDIQLPEINGYEATRQIRKFNKNIIIIAQTAYGLHGDKEKTIAAGCNDYIAKPINKHKLLASIQKYFKK